MIFPSNLLFVHFKEFVEDGSPVKKQKDYQNVINAPLITGRPDQTVMETLCLPELHLLLGIYKVIFFIPKHIGFVRNY